MRYILSIDAGASDHLTKMAEKEMATIEIMSGKLMDLGAFMVTSFLVLPWER